MPSPLPRVAALLLPLAVTAACSPAEPPAGADVPPATPSAAADGPVPIESLASLTGSGVDDSTRQVVRTAAEWAPLWERMHAPMGDVPAPPSMDFERAIVVVAAMGTRPSGGHEIAIDSVVRAGGALVVHVTSTSPGQGCMTTGALTQPVAAARVDATDAEVRFAERAVTREC